MPRLIRLVGFALPALGLIAPACAGSGSADSAAIECHASGGKLFAPPMTDEAVCAGFAAALRAAPRPAGALAVELSFTAKGTAHADVARGEAAPVRFSLAVSDRPFAARDLDRLAADVAAELGNHSPR